MVRRGILGPVAVPLDDRPLTTEPLALDLVNTRWPDEAGWHDLLDDPAARAHWLRRWGLGEDDARAAANLRQARGAVLGVLEHPGQPTPEAMLNGILRRGHLRPVLKDGVPGQHADIATGWNAGWTAARDLLDLLAARPARVKQCAGDDCVLWFADTTKSGTRRWCSMAACGNRAKARRYYGRRLTTSGDA